MALRRCVADSRDMRIAPFVTALLLTAAFCAAAAGCIGPSSSRGPVDPDCNNPAPLMGQPDPRTTGYIVQFQDDIDALDETARLSHVYAIDPTYVTNFVPLFFASFSDDVRDRLRCEPAVKAIEYESVGTPPPSDG